MDTKQMLEALEKAGVTVAKDYGDGLTYSDEAEEQCVDIWRRAILMDLTMLPAYIDDAVAEFMEDRDAITEISNNLVASYMDIKSMQTAFTDHPSFMAVFSTSITGQLATVGRLVLLGVHKSITDYLERTKEENLVDIASYVRDMEFDDRADYEYERQKDRQMEKQQ